MFLSFMNPLLGVVSWKSILDHVMCHVDYNPIHH